MKKQITSLILCLTLFLSLTPPGGGDEPLSLDGLMAEIDSGEAVKGLVMNPLSFSIPRDRQSIYIDKPTVTGGSGHYTYAYNIYDSNSQPVNYFYSDEDRVAATPGYGGLFNVFVVATDTVTHETVTRDVGWKELKWPSARTITMSRTLDYELSPDGKSIFINRPYLATASGQATLAYNIYDSNGKPVNYFYSTESRVAATPVYPGRFIVFVVGRDPVNGYEKQLDTGWHDLGTPPVTDPPVTNPPVTNPPAEPFEYIVENGGATITRYAGSDPNVVVPSTIGGYKVLAIGDRAFKERTEITSVQLPDTLERIGAYAFSDCSHLKKIVIPDSVTVLGESAFANCEVLASVTLSKNITRIEKSTFAYCKKLNRIKLPYGLKYIGPSAFIYCETLKAISIPDSVTEIGEMAFRGAKALNQLEFGFSVSIIGKSAFLDCASLVTIEIPGNVAVILDGTFQRCTGLTEITLENGVGRVEKNAFSNSENIEKMYLPRSLVYIDKYAVSNWNFIRIYCYSGSYAHTFAEENHISYTLR